MFLIVCFVLPMGVFCVLLCYSDDSKVPTNSFLFVCLLEASQIDKTEPLDIFPRLTRLTEARCVLEHRVLLRSSSVLLQVSQSATSVTDFSGSGYWLNFPVPCLPLPTDFPTARAAGVPVNTSNIGKNFHSVCSSLRLDRVYLSSSSSNAFVNNGSILATA